MSQTNKMRTTMVVELATSYLFCLCAASLTILYFVKTNHRPALPPGPQGHWFFGVKHLLPRQEPWKAYVEWSRLHGDSIISCRIYNRRLIILNDAQSIANLLVSRAHIYSSRPEQYMSHVVCGRSSTVFNISSQNPRHKVYRKLLQQGLGSKATRTYWPILQEHLSDLLKGLLKDPDSYIQHLRRNSVGVIMKVAFGYTIGSLNDTFVSIAEETSKITDMTMSNGSWLIDYFPIVRYIPSFLPGGSFKAKGRQWKERLNYLSDVPHQWAKRQIASGNYSQSFTSDLLSMKNTNMNDDEWDDIVKWCAGGLYVGASDTTVSAMISFMLLMALHPDVQACAWKEIKEVCGVDQIPHPSQLRQLVYLQAVLKEVLRYAPVGNLALPHKVIEDDIYHGYYIPKGSTIIANVWSVMHDEELFPDAFSFNPARFLFSNLAFGQPDPRQWAFGFGRRACPGTHFAETMMLLAMAGILSEFYITLPVGEPRPDISFTTGITSHIRPFKIHIFRRPKTR